MTLTRRIRLDMFDWKLYIRGVIFAFFLILFLISKDTFIGFLNYEIAFMRVYHIVFTLFMAEMLVVLFPKSKVNTFLGCGKVHAHNYVPKKYNKDKLYDKVKKENRAAAVVAVLWGLLLAAIGILKALRIIDKAHILLISLFFYLADQICINLYCPFRKLIMKNKCCNSCRIFNWGHFMMFSPLIFIPSVWTYSLVIVSFAILLHWEITLRKHPERFSEISNVSLRCDSCSAKCKWAKVGK